MKRTGFPVLRSAGVATGGSMDQERNAIRSICSIIPQGLFAADGDASRSKSRRMRKPCRRNGIKRARGFREEWKRKDASARLVPPHLPVIPSRSSISKGRSRSKIYRSLVGLIRRKPGMTAGRILLRRKAWMRSTIVTSVALRHASGSPRCVRLKGARKCWNC